MDAPVLIFSCTHVRLSLCHPPGSRVAAPKGIYLFNSYSYWQLSLPDVVSHFTVYIPTSERLNMHTAVTRSYIITELSPAKACLGNQPLPTISSPGSQPAVSLNSFCNHQHQMVRTWLITVSFFQFRTNQKKNQSGHIWKFLRLYLNISYPKGKNNL